MSSGVTRALAGIIGFFVALGIGLAVAGPLDLTPDENTGLVAAGNTLIVLFAVAFFFYRSGQDHDRAEAEAEAGAYGSTSPRRIA